jgi:hypothetical protein
VLCVRVLAPTEGLGGAALVGAVLHDDAAEQAIPEAPVREAPQGEGGLVDPVTGEALAPLRHE